MRELSFSYSTKIDFSGEVRDHAFTMKVLPKSSEIQHVLHEEIEVKPETDLTYGNDGFGNITVFGNCREPHTGFSAVSSGIVETGFADGDTEPYPEKVGIFKYPSGMTCAGDAVKALDRKLFSDELISPRDAAGRLTDFLYKNFKYEKGVTWVRTEADEALRTGSGVCQDFAHIFIAVMRVRHIPARYCVGMMTGEGESHAWAEVFDDGKWYGYDPTNGCLADDRYIRISVGRDAYDTRVSHGIFRGFVSQSQEVLVSVHDA